MSGKGKSKGKAKGSTQTQSQGYCCSCGSWGYQQADCRMEPAAKAAARPQQGARRPAAAATTDAEWSGDENAGVMFAVMPEEVCMVTPGDVNEEETPDTEEAKLRLPPRKDEEYAAIVNELANVTLDEYEYLVHRRLQDVAVCRIQEEERQAAAQPVPDEDTSLELEVLARPDCAVLAVGQGADEVDRVQELKEQPGRSAWCGSSATGGQRALYPRGAAGLRGVAAADGHEQEGPRGHGRRQVAPVQRHAPRDDADARWPVDPGLPHHGRHEADPQCGRAAERGPCLGDVRQWQRHLHEGEAAYPAYQEREPQLPERRGGPEAEGAAWQGLDRQAAAYIGRHRRHDAPRDVSATRTPRIRSPRSARGCCWSGRARRTADSRAGSLSTGSRRSG